MTLHRAPQHSIQSIWQARWLTLRESPRAILLGLLIVCAFGVFGWRLWYLQFVQGEYYRNLADVQRLETYAISAPRGIIYDSEGTPLVRNVPSFKVSVVPASLPNDENEAEFVLIRLAILLDMPYTTSGLGVSEDDPLLGVRDILHAALLDDNGNELPFSVYHRAVVVRRSVEREKALLIAQENLTLPGVLVEVDSRREYPYGPLVSQALGYLIPIPGERQEEYEAQGYDPDTDRVGIAGVEHTFEDVLRGQKGEQLVEEDVLGRVIRVVEERVAPVPGGNVYLTLDLDLQQFVENALRRGLANANSPRGVALLMRPQTGEILAMVSLPTYDNNLFAKGVSREEYRQLFEENPHRPLLNHAITDGLVPGSTFKIVVATGALQEGVLEPDTRLNCPGTIVLPNKYYPNDPGRNQKFYCWIWRQGSHGSLDVVGGLANSCNIFFYKVGGGFEEDDFEGLGPTRIARYARLFGFGGRTGVELTGEIDGLVPDPTWKRLTFGESWSTGNTYNLAIGEEYMSATPLQMLNAINVVANGGRLLRPRIVHHATDADGTVTQPFAPEMITHTLPISPEVWSLVQQGMEGAVAYGTATKAQVEGVRVAGKTGTAQFCDDIMCGTGGYDLPEHAWFGAFAPVENPEVSVLVFLYNGGEGSQKAAPVAQEILAHYFARNEVSSE
jgi:penicillin-binding protein 2